MGSKVYVLFQLGNGLLLVRSQTKKPFPKGALGGFAWHLMFCTTEKQHGDVSALDQAGSRLRFSGSPSGLNGWQARRLFDEANTPPSPTTTPENPAGFQAFSVHFINPQMGGNSSHFRDEETEVREVKS